MNSPYAAPGIRVEDRFMATAVVNSVHSLVLGNLLSTYLRLSPNAGKIRDRVVYGDVRDTTM